MRIAITSLCEFAARKGDLDFRYTPAPSALEGITGHARVQKNRGPGYQAEIRLEGQCEGLLLGGRADGYDESTGVLEEIKTHRGALSRMSDMQRELHWAQLRAYGALRCASEGLESIELRLTYYDIGRARETNFSEQADADALQQQLIRLCKDYRQWHEREMKHRERRNAGLAELVFPHTAFRGGQRDLAESVFKTICLDRDLMLQAPTGSGKTVGTLFPALMALGKQQLDKLFYLTSRNPVRQLALTGLARMMEHQANTVPLRVLEFSARTHSCEHPDLACHGESCPLAKGFFDRLPEARLEAVEAEGILDQLRLREIALAHELCPYFLAQELTRWCDVVVADVNRFFDQHAILHALTKQNTWRSILLVDEGHNLIDRARGMYSTELSQKRLLELKKQAPDQLQRPLQRFARQWTELLADQGLNKTIEDEKKSSTYLDMPPEHFVTAAQRLGGAITDYLSEYTADARLQDVLFELLEFIALADSFASHSICQLSHPRRGRAVLQIQNLIPADFLAPRFAAAQSTVLFSATLSPAQYYRDLLGLNAATHWQEIESPFLPRQLEVRLASHISTRLNHRSASVTPIVELIATQYQARPANYLAYFSSFAYLEEVCTRFGSDNPDIPLWRQRAGMSGVERQAFIEQFKADGQGVAFAVLGGAFAEGIDLPGERLYGVFIATLGLPPFDTPHRVLSERLQVRYGRGYEYTYLYPGLQKVSQAAGRVIRTPEDQGIVVLIDDRYARGEVRSLLPGWWQLGSTRQNS